MSEVTSHVTLQSFSTASKESHGSSIKRENTLPKEITFGNKCFHLKDTPKEYQSPVHHANKPYQLQKLKKGFHKFYDGTLKLFDHVIRSERREAIMIVGQCLTDYLDLLTGEVLPYLTIDKIIKLTGLGFRRIIRAMKELKKVGFLNCIRRWIQRNDRFIGLPSIKVVSDRLLYKLGLTHKELVKYRKRKSIDQRQKDAEAKSLKKFYETHKTVTNSRTSKPLPNRVATLDAKTVTDLISQCKLIPMRS